MTTMTKAAPPDSSDAYLTVKQVAKLLVVSERTVRRWISERHLKVVRLNRLVRITRSELDRFVRHRHD